MSKIYFLFDIIDVSHPAKRIFFHSIRGLLIGRNIIRELRWHYAVIVLVVHQWHTVEFSSILLQHYPREGSGLFRILVGHLEQ